MHLIRVKNLHTFEFTEFLGFFHISTSIPILFTPKNPFPPGIFGCNDTAGPHILLIKIFSK